MERTERLNDELVELGIVTEDTKGPPGAGKDQVGQLIGGEGLSHD